ncbi:hypothetical protein FLAG1_09872 [Fusarium langsethiae]|uniref:Uncharacterized protein n=1 Tax=Fusarium langsethiae TaxID=179993 RepID=A0A0N0DBV5_FUSLA|nr:hypothetical protein FLAG1_09872 [Fusarium langsethiae]GKU07029.1 unnamed protein product [Fusarium langsethiae]
MDHNIFRYGLIQGTSAFSSRNNDNIAYVTRDGTVSSVRNDDGRFLAALQSTLQRFDIEKPQIQHIFTKSGLEVYIQFSGWQRFVGLSWEGDSCKAIAELPRGLKNVVVELRKGTAVVPLGPASLERPTYRIDDRDIYTILFDPEAYNGFVVVFSADDAQRTGIRTISQPLACRGPLCQVVEASGLQLAKSRNLACAPKARPEVLRADPQRPNNVIDKDTSAGSHASSPGGDRQHVQGTQDLDGPTEDATGDDRQIVHDAEEPDGPTENTTEGFEEHRISNEDMEKKIGDCLSENRTSPYEVTELCAMFPGCEPESLVRAWYRVRERMVRKKRTELSSLHGSRAYTAANKTKHAANGATIIVRR